MTGYGISANAYRGGQSLADLDTTTEGDIMPAFPTLTNGAAWQLAQGVAAGSNLDSSDVDRLINNAGLNDADARRFRDDVAALTSAATRPGGTGSSDTRQAAADLADKWHDRIGHGKADPLRHEMDPAKLADAVGRNRW